MSYELIDDFSAGWDVRKSPLTAPGGSLTHLHNAAINPGGEIEKRRAFVQIADLTGSFGLASTAATLYVFGRNVSPSVPTISVPGVAFKGLKVPNANSALSQWDYDVFDGNVYLVALEPNVAWRHYYAGGSATAGNMVETQGTGKGYIVRTYQSKMYAVIGKILYFSAVNDPMQWDAGTGHGYINLSLQDSDSETLSALEVYYDKLAVFSSEAIQIWAVDPDPLQNAFVQLLRSTGTLAPRSPLQYGSGDVLYLDESGIRSVKARDSSNSAAVSDIGSPVDPALLALRRAKGDAYMNTGIALLEPSVGRFWLVFSDEIYVLSYFPGPKITAWSHYSLEFTVAHAVTCGGRIFLRSTNDKLYVYGGNNNQTYDNCGVDVRLPYLSGKKPGHAKIYEAVDMTVSGTWEARVSYNFNQPDAEESVGIFTQPTWNQGRAELTGYASHVSMRFYNNDANAASLSNIAIHYKLADEEA